MNRLSDQELEEINQMAQRCRESARLPSALRWLLALAIALPFLIGLVIL